MNIDHRQPVWMTVGVEAKRGHHKKGRGGGCATKRIVGSPNRKKRTKSVVNIAKFVDLMQVSGKISLGWWCDALLVHGGRCWE